MDSTHEKMITLDFKQEYYNSSLGFIDISVSETTFSRIKEDSGVILRSVHTNRELLFRLYNWNL